MRPHGLYPARHLCPWDSPGRNTGVGCHFPLQGKLYLFFHLFVFPTLGLCCCMRAFSSCAERELLSSCLARASHCSNFTRCGAPTLGCSVFSICGTQTQQSRGRRTLLRRGMDWPALAAEPLTTEPTGKSRTAHSCFPLCSERWEGSQPVLPSNITLPAYTQG